jgi:carbon-monoxide dehydrogenase small subunit
MDSCLLAVHSVAGSEITTIEGVGEPGGALSPLQEAMVRAGGVQCGFCTPGFVMTLTALLADQPNPAEDDIRRALAGNICRCTGYAQIVDAVLTIAGSGR